MFLAKMSKIFLMERQDRAVGLDCTGALCTFPFRACRAAGKCTWTLQMKRGSLDAAEMKDDRFTI